MDRRDDEYRQDDGSLHVVGYGSLMWMPGFDPIGYEPVRVSGWDRRFSLYSTQAWGSESRPGLSLGIYPGGTMLALSLKAAPYDVSSVLDYLDEREAAYQRARVKILGLDGKEGWAMTYVPDADHPRWRPDLSLDEQAVLIAQGKGFKGSSRSYLENTVAFLDRYGERPGAMHDLLARVQAMT